MEEEEGISKLPEEIIQHILCNFLSAKEAAQARLLSKAWLTAWQTCPVLTFEQPYFEREFVTPDERKHKQHMFRVFVDKVLLNYQEKKIGIHTFKLRMRLGYDSSDNESVNEWMKVAAGNGLKKLHLSVVFSSYILPPTILETKSLEDLFLQGCIFEQQLRGGVMCSNLRRLVLKYVNLSDEMLQKILSSCRQMEFMNIFRCLKLRTIQLNNLARLKELSVCYNQEQSVEIDVPNLESLTCEGVGYLHDKMPRMSTKLPHVQDLKITSCDLLNAVKISSESLKLIQLKFNKKLEELQVDAPNVVRFVYMGASIPRVGCTPSSSNWESRIHLFVPTSNHIDNSWFAKLRDMLTNLIHSKIYLDMWSPSSVTFSLDDIRGEAVKPGPEIEMLSIEAPALGIEARAGPALVDGCFWSCRPKVIWQRCCHDKTIQFTDFVYYLLSARSIHWRETKFWHKHLKDVKVVIMKRTGTKWQPEIFGWKSLLDVEPNNSSGVKKAISFNLEW